MYVCILPVITLRQYPILYGKQNKPKIWNDSYLNPITKYNINLKWTMLCLRNKMYRSENKSTECARMVLKLSMISAAEEKTIRRRLLVNLGAIHRDFQASAVFNFTFPNSSGKKSKWLTMIITFPKPHFILLNYQINENLWLMLPIPSNFFLISINFNQNKSNCILLKPLGGKYFFSLTQWIHHKWKQYCYLIWLVCKSPLTGQ